MAAQSETLTWARGEQLGAGTPGAVRREKEQGSGELGVVKIVSKAHLRKLEVDALPELQDPCPHLIV